MKIYASSENNLDFLKPSLRSLLHLHTLYMSHITGEDNREEMIKDWLDPYRVDCYFMVESGHVVGACITDIALPTSREISLLLTHPSYYRRHIATDLLNHCIRRSEMSGFTNLNLQVAKDNSKAIELYKKHGFGFTDISGHMYKMSRSLSSSDYC